MYSLYYKGIASDSHAFQLIHVKPNKDLKKLQLSISRWKSETIHGYDKRTCLLALKGRHHRLQIPINLLVYEHSRENKVS